MKLLHLFLSAFLLTFLFSCGNTEENAQLNKEVTKTEAVENIKPAKKTLTNKEEVIEENSNINSENKQEAKGRSITGKLSDVMDAAYPYVSFNVTDDKGKKEMFIGSREGNMAQSGIGKYMDMKETGVRVSVTTTYESQTTIDKVMPIAEYEKNKNSYKGKVTKGKLTDIQYGDTGVYLSLLDENNKEIWADATLDFFLEDSFKGKQVAITFTEISTEEISSFKFVK